MASQLNFMDLQGRDLTKALFIEESIGDMEVTCPRGVTPRAGHTGHGVLGQDFQPRPGGCTAVLRARDVASHVKRCTARCVEVFFFSPWLS